MTYSVSAPEFMFLLAHDSVTVLDLRDEDLFDEADLPNAIKMSMTTLPSKLNQLDKKKTYYLVSQFGKRSQAIANFLDEQGFQAVNVIGGASAYQHYLAS